MVSDAYISIRTSDGRPLSKSIDFKTMDRVLRESLVQSQKLLSVSIETPISLVSLEGIARRIHGDIGPVLLQAHLALLGQARLLTVSSSTQTSSLSFVPYSAEVFNGMFKEIPRGRYVLSRFVCLRFDSTIGRTVLECPIAQAHFETQSVEIASVIGRLLATRQFECTNSFGIENAIWQFLLAGLFSGGFIRLNKPEIDNDQVGEELPYWEFHDLYFHSRSRLGRHSNLAGATFRMAGKYPPEPAVKQLANCLAKIKLPKIFFGNMPQRDMFLSTTLERRSSVRQHSELPLTLLELSEFLFRCFAVRGLWKSGDIEFTKRSYPSGGASYDIEVYILVNKLNGLDPGTYHYDPLDHCLNLLKPDCELMRSMFEDALRACADTCYPHLLIILTSRFKRVSWKYSAIAYSTILKNVGVVYAHMYLLATAMNLAPCALGLGDSEKFAHLTGIDYFEEGSIGEFMIGRVV